MARRSYFFPHEKCVHSDFGVILCCQDGYLLRSKCLLLLRVLVWVSKTNIGHGNLLVRISGALKNGSEAIFHAKTAWKVIFLTFGHEDLSQPPRYYGCLDIPISVLDCPNHSPQLIFLDCNKWKMSFFHALAIFRDIFQQKCHFRYYDPDVHFGPI